MDATFADAICNHSSPSIDCECGITWFTHEADDYEALLAKEKSEPGKYRHSDDDSIGWAWFEGRQRAWGCPTCMERFQRAEEWILENEESIREFLKRYGKQRLEQAQRLLAIDSPKQAE